MINATADPPDVTTTVTVGQDPFGIAIAPLSTTSTMTIPSGASTSTTTTTAPPGTTPLACTTTRCLLDAATTSRACAGQTIPGTVTTKLIKAENLIDHAATSPTMKARMLLTRARKALKHAGTTATRLAKGKKAKLSAACAGAVADAANHVAVGLQH